MSLRSSSRVALLAVPVALALLAVPARTASAQGASVDLTLFGGIYVPTGDFDDLGSDIENQRSVALGGRLTFWGGGRIGVEGTFAFAPSDVDNPSGGGADIDARVVTGNASLLVGLLPSGSTAALFLRGGLALIARGGDAFENIDGKTDVGGVVGVGLRVPLGPVIGLRIDAEDYLYNAKFGSSRSSFQNDLMFTAGLAISLTGGR